MIRFDSAWKGCVVDLSKPIRPNSRNTLKVTPFEWHHGDSGSTFNWGKLNYQGNLPHFTQPTKGAFTVHEGDVRRQRFGFTIGSPDYPSRTRKHAKVAMAQRWMNSVFGIQFEWDSGIEYTNSFDGDHMNPMSYDHHGQPKPETGSKGYHTENIWITMGMVSTRGVIIEDFILPLVKDGKLCDHVAYWYEGYSLYDPIKWTGQYKVP